MWQLLFTVLVITAVIISVLKYTLPHIGVYRTDIQDWVRQHYGAEIYIGNISAGWEGTGPAILLQNISFLPNESAQLDLVIKETRVKLDFWKSIKRLQLTSDHFVLDGLVATIDGRSLIKTSDGTQVDAPLMDALSKLVLRRLQKFSVVNSQINLNTPSEVVQHITIEELTWYNDKLQHQGVGKLKLGDFAANSLSFILDLHGAQRSELTGQLYVEATELDISPWMHQFVTQKSSIEQSNINFQSWATIDKGLFERAQINLGQNEIEWERDNTVHQLKFGEGQLVWVPSMNGWEITSSDIKLSSDHVQWPTLNVNINKQAEQFNFYFSQIAAQRAVDLLSLIDVDTQVVKALDTYKPDGLIQNFFIEFEAQESWKLTGLFTDFGWDNVSDVPGAQRLSGHFGLTADAGWINVEGSDAYLLTGSLFKKPIYYESFDVNLSFWQDAEQTWQLHGDNLWLHNNDIDLVGEFSVELSDDPTIAAYAEVSGNDLSMADNYYPPEYIGQDTIDYLNGAIKAGSLEMAQLLWSGPLNAFPYDNNEGLFLVNTQVSEVDFLFTAGWPVLSNVDGELIFRNDSLTIYPKKGYFLDIDITDKAVAVIPSLSESLWLDLDIAANVAPKKVAKLFKASPLRDIFSPVFEQLNIHEDVTANAQIRIPLVSDLNEFEQLLDYKGDVSFTDNTIDIATPGIHLTDVGGVLKFDKEKIWTEKFAAKWLDQAFTAQLEGRQQQTQYNLAITANGQADIGQLLTRLDDPLKDYLEGEVPVKAEIGLSFPEQGVTYGVTVNADLESARSTLPQPYQKAVDTTAWLKFNIKGDEISSLITANYDNQLFFNGILPNSQATFSQAHLILADQDMGLAGDGFKITVDLKDAEVMPWYYFVDNLVNGASHSDAPPLLDVPRLITGKIGELRGFDQRLHGVNFELTEGNGSWDLILNAKETRTVAHIDRDWDGKGVTIKTEYLRLISNEEDESPETVIDSGELIASLPPIDFSCMDCQYNQYNLARVDIETSTTVSANSNKLNINKFNITKGKHQLQAQGEWIGDRANGLSTFSGRLISDDIGNLLKEYDITSTVRDSDAKMDIVANWAGGPHQFNLPSLGGEVKWALGDGRLTEISDRGLRIFSLLSLDSIVRKLTLDFRDVFSKGFFYNSIKGTMLIDSGIGYTDNTEIDGGPANLSLQGNVNLMDQTLDYEFYLVPKVTSSLPMIIGWMVSPITGIAALALDKMLESTEVIAQVHFSITGTISEPVVTEIERKSRDMKLPKTVSRPSVIPQVQPLSPKKFAETEPLQEVPKPVTKDKNNNIENDNATDGGPGEIN